MVNEAPTKPPKLTLKQEWFCQYVVRGETQADAYRLAFKPPHCKTKTLYEKASRLMAVGKIKARITAIIEPTITKIQVTREQWLKSAERFYLGDVRKLFDEHGNPRDIPTLGDNEAAMVEGFEVVEDFTKVKHNDGSTDAVPTGFTKKYKLTSPQKAHEYFGKVMGYYQNKVEHTFSLEQAILSAHARRNALKAEKPMVEIEAFSPEAIERHIERTADLSGESAEKVEAVQSAP